MILYLLRHGHSPSPAEAGVRGDAERPLSERGRADARRAAEAMTARGAKVGLILHSPLRRAAETAREAARVLHGPPTEGFPGLANALPAEAVRDLVRRRSAGVDEVLLVGHMPQLGELAGLLAGVRFTPSPAGLIALQPGDDAPGRALWSFEP